MEDTIFTGDGAIGKEIKKMLDAQKKGVDLFNSFQRREIDINTFETFFPAYGENYFQTCIKAGERIAAIAKKRLAAIGDEKQFKKN